jgi:hypothetical protein
MKTRWQDIQPVKEGCTRIAESVSAELSALIRCTDPRRRRKTHPWTLPSDAVLFLGRLGTVLFVPFGYDAILLH